MMRSRAGRVAAMVLTMAVGVGLSAGPAAAGVRPSTSYFASAFVGSGGASGSEDVFADVTVWKPSGTPAFANGEFFVRGYDCTTEDTTRAGVDGLRSAWAKGRLSLDCWKHDGGDGPQHVTGTAVLHLRWTGTGEVTHRTLRNPDCTYRFADRHAEVTGRVKIVLPEIDFRARATSLDAESDHITRERAYCR